MKKVMFISSSGGHLNELLSLKPTIDKFDSYIITEKTASTLYLKKQYMNKVYYLKFGTRHQFFYFIIAIINIIKSLFLFIKIRPHYIVSTGSHTAVAMCYIGKLFRKKIIYIESYANVNTKSLSGKIVYPIADVFIVQWKEMLELYPNAIYGGSVY